MERFVKEATWKDLLLELVRKNEFDPWDIDISRLVEEYLATIRQIKLLDLRVPANMILAAAILVRLKSELLSLNEQEEQEVNEAEEKPVLYANSLLPRLRIPPKRKITLQELLEALDEAMKIKETREQSMAQNNIKMAISLPVEDIEEEAENVLKIIKDHEDRLHMITFSSLIMHAEGKDPLLQIFIPLLFLAQKGSIDIMQEVFFGEIIIKELGV